MELTIHILLPQTADRTHLNLSQKEYTWDGKVYPQGLARRTLFAGWIIEETPLADYLRRQLPMEFSETDWMCLHIRGAGLDDYVISVLDPENDQVADNNLAAILGFTLNRVQEWIVLFEINDNPIEAIYYDTPETLPHVIPQRLQKRVSFMACSMPISQSAD